jgi:HAD superfamily hydrolase (TIGR01509 family)
MIRGLVFDFDGLIVDTESATLRVWQELYEEHGCELPLDEWETRIGLGAGAEQWDPCAHLERMLGQTLDREVLQARRRGRRDALIAAERARPGVERYLADARQLALQVGIASSSPFDWIAHHLERLGLQAFFDCIRCGDHVQQAKPAPDVYVAALESLRLRPGEAIAFEDSPNGVRAAKAAGLFCVAVPNPATARLLFDDADMRLVSLAELPLALLLERVGGREQPK